MTEAAGFVPVHLNAPGATTLLSGFGILHTLTINRLGGASTSVMLIRDGAVMASISTAPGAVAPTTLTYNATVAGSLVIVLAGAPAPDVTVTVRKGWD